MSKRVLMAHEICGFIPDEFDPRINIWTGRIDTNCPAVIADAHTICNVGWSLNTMEQAKQRRAILKIQLTDQTHQLEEDQWLAEIDAYYMYHASIQKDIYGVGKIVLAMKQEVSNYEWGKFEIVGGCKMTLL